MITKNLKFLVIYKMIKRKQLRQHGKIRLSHYFQKFKEGDKVCVIREHSLNPKFPTQIQGRSGIISGKRGSSYIIKINDLNKEKVYIVHPAHLRKVRWKLKTIFNSSFVKELKQISEDDIRKNSSKHEWSWRNIKDNSR